MVERARLESVYTPKGIEGSNPSLSAKRNARLNRAFLFKVSAYILVPELLRT